MNRKNLLITLALFAFTPPAMAVDCVAGERNGEITASPTNPDSCYFYGKWSGVWELRLADGTVKFVKFINGELQKRNGEAATIEERVKLGTQGLEAFESTLINEFGFIKRKAKEKVNSSP